MLPECRGLLAGGAAGLLASGGAASAADSTTTVTPATSSTPAASDATASSTTRATETPLAGDDLAKATAAALAASPGANFVRAETDADGAAFEVDITVADGSQAIVELNSDFTVKTISTGQGAGGGGGPHVANGITETPLTGDDLTKATAAAATAAPGATVVRAETDADGAAFEVHITMADGSRATVELNSDFTVKAISTDQSGGRGHGGRGHGAVAPAAGTSATPSSTTTA